MKWALIILAALSLIELFIWVKLVWKVRKFIAGILIISQSVTTGLLFGFSSNLWSLTILVAGIYRVINLLRLLEGRSSAQVLYKVTRISSLKLLTIQICLGVAWFLAQNAKLKSITYLYIYSILGLLVSLSLLISLFRSLRKTRLLKPDQNYASKDLPSISVLIPARNETIDLEQCLSALVASAYPKLEILVLDDCSQNKRTPEIIKSFAQAGVRFIAGETPPGSWLAKNFAYEQLVSQATGEILVFAGVDTRFAPYTLTKMVEDMLKRRKSMMSYMPTNAIPSKLNLGIYIFQPARYAWELALPRRLFNRPPVLSTCWLISESALKKYGGFKAVTHTAIPERFFAKLAIRDNDGYSFIRGNSELGLSSEKAVEEQKATAIRTRYPEAHRHLDILLTYSAVETLGFLVPFLAVLYSLIQKSWLCLTANILSIAILSFCYYQICRLTYSKKLPLALILWPVAAIADIAILNYSMWQYEFKEVLWKGRNVCLPVMHSLDPGPAQQR